ncbi:unnamed protein product, partial [Fusarium langsethiae]
MAQVKTQKKVAVVIGATGLQGGSVAQVLSASSHKYTVRGLSRNLSSSKAQAMSATKEEAQGKSIMDIAADLPELEHLIWADLPNARKISDGQYTNVYHWQSKAAVSDYIRLQKPALWKRTTTVLFPNYFENCVTQPATYLPVK